MYSITNRESFTAIEDWKTEATKHGGDNIKMLLVGNKSDCENDREVSTEEGVVGHRSDFDVGPGQKAERQLP